MPAYTLTLLPESLEDALWDGPSSLLNDLVFDCFDRSAPRNARPRQVPLRIVPNELSRVGERRQVVRPSNTECAFGPSHDIGFLGLA